MTSKKSRLVIALITVFLSCSPVIAQNGFYGRVRYNHTNDIGPFDSITVGPTDPNALVTIRGDTEFVIAPRIFGSDELFLIDTTAGDGVDNYGGSISFSGPGRADRQAAIVARQSATDVDHVGLDFLVHAVGSASGGMTTALTIDVQASSDIKFGFLNPSPESPLTVGTNSTVQGIGRFWDGGGGNTPGHIIFGSPNGTVWYLFVEDDGTVKIHNAAPTQNADGSAIGGQTD